MIALLWLLFALGAAVLLYWLTRGVVCVGRAVASMQPAPRTLREIVAFYYCARILVYIGINKRLGVLP